MKEPILIFFMFYPIVLLLLTILIYKIVKHQKQSPIPYSLEKYQTGKYRVVTRGGDKVIVRETTPNLLVTIPTKQTCRKGHYDYGYMPNGQWNLKTNHELDLFLIKKWFA